LNSPGDNDSHNLMKVMKVGGYSERESVFAGVDLYYTSKFKISTGTSASMYIPSISKINIKQTIQEIARDVIKFDSSNTNNHFLNNHHMTEFDIYTTLTETYFIGYI
jgi:hypothetical protein